MAETTLKIRLFGDPALRKKARPVKKVNAYHREILSKIARLMYENSGIGLAASQVGIDETMIVLDIGEGLYKLINPRILKKEGAQTMQEGCLSVPGVCLKIKRAKKVIVAALDENAKPVSIEAKGLFACVLQHEIDHLHGRLIVDYASFLDQIKIRKKLKQLQRDSRNEELPESETKSCKLQL